MKTLTALLTAATLTLSAGLAQADVRVDEIPQLVKDGKIKPLEDLNRIALDLHPVQRSPKPNWTTTSTVTSTKSNCVTPKTSSGMWTSMPPTARS